MKSLKALWFAAALAVGACNGNTTTTTTTTEEEEEEDLSAVATCPAEGAAACAGDTKQVGENCEYTGSDAVTVSGTAQDFQSERALSGAIVNVMDNDTGKPTGICGVTNASGEISIKVPKDKKIGFATVYEGAKDTYQFNLIYAADSEETLFSVSSVTAQLIPGLIGATPDETKGIVAGTVYNKFSKAITDTTTTYKVRSKDGQDAFYFGDDGLPTDLESQAALNPENALYVIFDLAPGQQEIELLAGSDVTATTDNKLWAFPDSVAISNIVCTGCEK